MNPNPFDTNRWQSDTSELRYKLQAVERFSSDTLDKLIHLERENKQLNKELEKLLGHEPAAIDRLKKDMEQAKSLMDENIATYNSKSSKIQEKIEMKLRELSSLQNDAEKAKAINGELRETILDLMMEAEKRKYLINLAVSFIFGVVASLVATWLWARYVA